MAKIVVVGAGVVGLTTALELLNQTIRHHVTIVAAQLPTDFDFSTNYTSPYAGANWHSFASKDDIKQQKIDTVGYKKFTELAKHRPESGVVAGKNINYVTREKYSVDAKSTDKPWFSKLANGKSLSLYDHTLFASAFEYDGFIITTTYYLSFLLNECLRTGRFTIRRRDLKTLDEAFDLFGTDRADIVINCSGLRAKQLVPDPEMYPVRGVTVVIENNVGLKDLLSVKFVDDDFPEESLYIMPRGDGSIVIGGCFEVRKTTSIAEKSQVDRLLERVRRYTPHVGWKEFKISRTQVGLRPYRESGLRIEADPSNPKIIHCYGHGGFGYQASWGSAAEVVHLVDKHLAKKLISKL